MMMDILRCPSCDGYGWLKDDFSGEDEDCDWCGGIGYVYRDEAGVDQRIPHRHDAETAARIEALEQERLREMGYTGEARKPWEQAVRQGTRGGINPYEDSDSADADGEEDEATGAS